MSEVTYRYFFEKDLYDFLVDWKQKDPWYKISELAERIHYFQGNDLCNQGYSGAKHHYFCALVDDKIVGMIKIKKGGPDSLFHKGYCNWICFCSVDPEYHGQKISSKLTEMLFEFCKKENINMLTSGYTEVGFQKLKPLFKRVSERVGVDFMDDRTQPEF